MRIRLTTDRVGDRYFQLAGAVVDLPVREAQMLLAAGQAETVPASSEGATLPAEESPPSPQGRTRHRR